MILQALINYADRLGLGDANFDEVDVRWLIFLDKDGQFTSLAPLFDDPAAKKSGPKTLLRPFTSPNELNQGDKSHFLCDSLERVALLVGPKTNAAARKVQHGYFVHLLAECATQCPTEGKFLLAAKTFLSTPGNLEALQASLLVAKAKPTDNVTFSVDGRILLDLEEMRAYWRAKRSTASQGKKIEASRYCLATDDFAPALSTHEKISGIPGGLAMGTNLIAFDKDSFCSYGLDQAQNAPISAPAELKIRAALNALIEKSRSQRLIYSGVIYLHWSKRPLDIDPWDLITSNNEDEIAALLQSVQATGKEHLGGDDDAYYACALSGNGARIVVRSWLETTVTEVRRNVAKWFTDLAIADHEGAGIRRDFKFGALLYSLVRKELDELPPQLPAQLMNCALNGGPLPQAILATALRRHHLESENRNNPWRLALIRACLNRSQNNPNNQMKETLDQDSKDLAYRCGQLFAVMGRLQLLALGKVGASIIDRTYGGVATRPASTLGPIFTKLPAYIKKSNSRWPGSGENKQKEIESLSVVIESLGGIPKTLGLEAQGRFALGYYCQLAQYRADKEEAKAAKEAAELELTEA